jgi:hypothetical protein
MRLIPNKPKTLSTQKNLPRNSRVPSHIYKRGDLYYFRFVFPESFKAKFGREIRLSLNTPFRRKALELSGKLYAELVQYLDDPEMDLMELKHQLDEQLKNKLKEDEMNLGPREPDLLYKDIKNEHPDYTYSDACRHIVKELANDINNLDSLKNWSHEAIPALVQAKIIDPNHANNASEYDKLVATNLAD